MFGLNSPQIILEDDLSASHLGLLGGAQHAFSHLYHGNCFIFVTKWMMVEFTPHWYGCNIAFLELYNVVKHETEWNKVLPKA